MDDVSGTEVRSVGLLRIQPQQTARREFGDESVVLDLQRSTYFGLNRSAGVLWQRLLSGATRSELIDCLAGAGAPRENVDEVGRDVDEFIVALRQEGLVHDVDA